MNLPATTPHRPVILKVDLKPMQLADKNPYYNIMAPKVVGNISTETYESLFQTYKVIYPDYASRHFVTDLKKTLVMDTMFKGSLGGETSVLRTFRVSGKELVKERVSKERVRQGKS